MLGDAADHVEAAMSDVSQVGEAIELPATTLKRMVSRGPQRSRLQT
jgi:hypothetical protein